MICINSITICPESVTITKGKWYCGAYAQVCPTNATCQCVTWHSSNPNVANVNQNGYIFGVSEGAAVIYATAQDGSGAVGFCNVTVVSPVKVSSVTVTPSTKTLNVGDSFGLSATVCPDNADDKRIRWTSCDCNIADVDYLTGCVIAKSVGTTCICANAVDGSGVQGGCEVTVNVPDRGTDSIGVFRMLSMHSAAPDDTETEAPVMRGIQFSDPQNENYKIRFVSQIKTLNYKRVGYEVHYKIGDAAPVADIICLDKVYESLLADGEPVDPDEGFEYFVLGVKDNIPQNTVVSFKITPFAITLEGEFLRGSTMLFSCKDAQVIEDVDFEIPEHLNTSTHIRVNTGEGNNLNVRSLPSINGTVLGRFANGTEIALVLETPQNEKWYAVYGQTIDGTYKFGWCSGEYLEHEVEYGTLVDVDTLNVRSGASTGYTSLGRINRGDKVEILEKNCATGSGYTWHKILYNKSVGYVVAGNNTPNFTFETSWVALVPANSSGDFLGDYADFLEVLGYRESSNNYTAVNGSYLGKYQIGPAALIEAGFKNSNGTWTSLAQSYGVTSNETFLSSQNAQEYAVRAYHKKVWGYLEHYGAEDILGKNYYNVIITESGLLAAAHLVGAYGVVNAIKNNTNIKDGLGTPAYEYLSLMKNYDISEIK